MARDTFKKSKVDYSSKAKTFNVHDFILPKNTACLNIHYVAHSSMHSSTKFMTKFSRYVLYLVT